MPLIDHSYGTDRGLGYDEQPNECQMWKNNFENKKTLSVITGSSDEEETDCDQPHGHVNMVDTVVADETDSVDSEWDGEWLIPDVYEGEDEYTPARKESLTREEKLQL